MKTAKSQNHLIGAEMQFGNPSIRLCSNFGRHFFQLPHLKKKEKKRKPTHTHTHKKNLLTLCIRLPTSCLGTHREQRGRMLKLHHLNKPYPSPTPIPMDYFGFKISQDTAAWAPQICMILVLTKPWISQQLSECICKPGRAEFQWTTPNRFPHPRDPSLWAGKTRSCRSLPYLHPQFREKKWTHFREA